jgi:hypothetical protein
MDRVSRLTRSDARFNEIIEQSCNKSIGYGEYPPLEMLKLLLKQYSIKSINKEILTNEIQMLLHDRPEELDNFREEMKKYKLTLALKNNFMENSSQYTIRPFQKPTRKTRSVIRKNSKSTRRIKSNK